MSDDDGGGGGGGSRIRDPEEMAALKKLIVDEKSRQKGARGKKKPAAGFADSDDEEAEDKRPSKKEVAAAEAAAAAAPVSKKIWRRGKLVQLDTKDDRFRDRAAERRSGINPDYDNDLERMVLVDAEKSKYLGGDLRHTHLVKGLDFALLAKVREEARQKRAEQQRKSLAMERGLAAEPAGDEEAAAQVATEKQHQQQVPVRTLAAKALYGVWRQMQSAGEGRSQGIVQDFHRMVYEYDADPDNPVDAPVTIHRGRGDADDGEERRINFMMDDELLRRISRGLDSFRQHGGRARRLKKRKLAGSGSGGGGELAGSVDEMLAAAAAPPPPPRPVKKLDIFGDAIPENDGSGGGGGYGGVAGSGPAALAVPKRETEPRAPPPPPRPPTLPPVVAAGYFANLRAAAEPMEVVSAEPSREEIARSIRVAASAAAKRAAEATGKAVPGDGRVDRDVFAGAAPQGHAVAGSGSYNFYPENADYENYDSDDGGGGERRGEGGGGGGGGGKPERKRSNRKPKEAAK